MGWKVVGKKRGSSENATGKNKRSKLVNYILGILVFLGILNGLISNYFASNYLSVVILLLGGFFVIYSLFKRLIWVYYFFLVVNVFLLIYKMITISFLLVFWVEGLWSLGIILMSYYMLTEINPKKFKKFPWFK